MPGFVQSLFVSGVTAKSAEKCICMYIRTYAHTGCSLAGRVSDTVGIPPNGEMVIRGRF